jgi:hypothetical protein
MITHHLRTIFENENLESKAFPHPIHTCLYRSNVAKKIWFTLFP